MKRMCTWLSMFVIVALVVVSCPLPGSGAEPQPLSKTALRLSSLKVFDGEKFILEGGPLEEGVFRNADILSSFHPAVNNYTVHISEETMGVKIDASPVPRGADIEFTSDAYWPDAVRFVKNGKNSATSFDFGNWPPGMATFETIGPWQTSYHGKFTVNATIKVVDRNFPDNFLEYKIEIVMADGTDAYALFDSYEADDGYQAATNVTIPFNIYVPQNPPPAPNEKLPVVYVMHGNTCRLQPVDYILRRYQAAPIWAMDSEAYPSKRCIVLVPQRTELDFTDYFARYEADKSYQPPVYNQGVPPTVGWYEWNANNGEGALTPFGEGAYQLLEELLQGTLKKDGVYDYTNLKNNIDLNRVYITGLSMGGAGTLGTMIKHGDTFAAAFANCPLFPLSEANAYALKDKAFWFNHGVMDHVDVNNSLNSYDRLVAAGNTNVHKTIYPDTYFMFENHHYTWVPAYKNREIRDWLFAQRKD